jgi:hypothetical protein
VRIREGVSFIMSEPVTNDDLDLETNDEPNGPKELRQAYKQAAAAKAQAEAEAAAARAELDQIRREQAFANAGIDVNSPQGKFFAENYNGSPDEIAAKAAELGLVGAKTPSVPVAEQQAWQSTANLSAGAPAAPAADESHGIQYGDSPQVIAEKLRRAGQPVGSSVQQGPGGPMWTGRPA